MGNASPAARDNPFAIRHPPFAMRHAGINRRRFLASTVALATATAVAPLPSRAQGRSLRFADMHSHLGLQRGDLADVREAMTRNALLRIARKIVADVPVTRRTQSRGIHVFRDPRPGELAKYFDGWIEILRAQNRKMGLAEIVSAEGLDRAVSAGEPCVVIAAEGGDFL